MQWTRYGWSDMTDQLAQTLRELGCLPIRSKQARTTFIYNMGQVHIPRGSTPHPQPLWSSPWERRHPASHSSWRSWRALSPFAGQRPGTLGGLHKELTLRLDPYQIWSIPGSGAKAGRSVGEEFAEGQRGESEAGHTLPQPGKGVPPLDGCRV